MGNKINTVFVVVFLVTVCFIAYLFAALIGSLISYPPENLAPYYTQSYHPMGNPTWLVNNTIFFKNYECNGGSFIIHGYYYFDWVNYRYSPSDYIIDTSPTPEPSQKPLCFPENVNLR